MKVCTSCKINKKLTEFHSGPRYRFGVTAQCKECRNAAIRSRYYEIKLLPKPAIVEKQCAKCGETKAVEHFSMSKSDISGYKRRCKECVSRCLTSYNWRNSPKRSLINKLRGYGMTIPDYEAMLDSQGLKCACCGVNLERPMIDHNHDTGFVRAIICNRCNVWLAPLENREFMTIASRYLNAVWPERFKISAVLAKIRQRQNAKKRDVRRA